MQKILLFLYRHLTLWIFLLLEIGSVALLVNHNSFQQSVAFRIGTTVSAWCYSLTSSVSQYFGLNTTNALLARQNAELLNANQQLRQQLAAVAPPDSSLAAGFVAPEIRYIDARVIYNSLYRTQNYIIINKGSRNGIAPDMGVFAATGIVGVVERVSLNYAVVLPLINPDQRISAKLKKSQQLGSIIWKGYDPYHIQMDEVPAHASPAVGDTIITSGYSAIFPEGMMIGVIDKAQISENARFWNINLVPAVDFSKLNYVTVAAYANLDEYKTIEAGL